MSGAALVAALLLAGACARTEPVDLVLSGVRLLDAAAVERGHAGPPGWVAIRQGAIAELGSGAPPAARRVVDLDGAVVASGFVDHHVHLLNVGLSLVNRDRDDAVYLDLGGHRSLAALAEAVAARAAALPEGEWILGKGWSQLAWGEDTLPDRAVLDRAAPRHPVFLTRVDGHAGWANAAALAAAGIDAATPDPPGGRILRRADGAPSGVLMERANEPVLALLPRPDDDTTIAALRRACEAMAALGVTDVYDAGFLTPPGIVGLNDDLERYLGLLAAADAEPLAVDVRLMIPVPSALGEKLVADPDAYRHPSPRVEVTHLKLFADGALGSRGGHLSHPYADDPGNLGVERMDSRQILSWSRRGLDAGLDVATHAIGDAAVAAALDAYEELLGERPDLDPGRLRIEHFSYAAEADFERAARLGVVLSIQPDFVYADDSGRAMEDARLSAASDRAYAWGRLERAGARLAAGGDYFTFPGAPMLGFQTAAYRTNEHGLPPDGWHPDERLPPAVAWRLFTTLHPPGGGPPVERRLGVGEPADLAILSSDPLTAEPAELPAIAVRATLRGGVPTWDDGSLSGLDAEAPR